MKAETVCSKFKSFLNHFLDNKNIIAIRILIILSLKNYIENKYFIK